MFHTSVSRELGISRSRSNPRRQRTARQQHALSRFVEVERLEDRTLLASFAETGSGATLALNLVLRSPSEAVGITSNGTTYSLVLNSSNTWTGTDVAGQVTGNGLGTLTVTGGQFPGGVSIIDSTNAGDSVTFNNSAGNYLDSLSVNLSNASAGAITFNGSTSFSGSSALSATTTAAIYVAPSSSVTTADGNLTLSANQQGTPTVGNFIGVEVNNATIQSTGAGAVTVSGTGGNDSGGSQYGLYVHAGGKISGGTTQPLTVTGTGGASTGINNFGVFLYFASPMITSLGGNVQLTGTGGGAGAGSDIGVLVSTSSTVTAGGSGTVTVLGTGGAGSGGDEGVYLTGGGASITSSGGNVRVTGIEGGAASGVAILNDNTDAFTTAANGGTLTLIGNSMNFYTGTTISAPAGSSATLLPYTNGVGIVLGSTSDPIGGPLSLSAAELGLISAGTINIGNTNSGAITFSAHINPTLVTNIALTTGSGQNIALGGNTLTVTGNATLTTSGTGGITDTASSNQITAVNVTLDAGSGGIGDSTSGLGISASGMLTTNTSATNGNQYLRPIGMVTTAASASAVNAGTGTLTLLGAGALALGANDAINTGAAINVSGATLSLGSDNQHLAGVTLTSGSITGTTGTLTSTNTIQTQSGSASAILAGTNGLTQSTSGTTTLSGANTYSGATSVAAGTLQVDGSLAAGSAVTVQNGATLDGATTFGGTGTVSGTVDVQNGGHLHPGHSPGIIHTGALTLESGSFFNVDITGASAGTGYSQVVTASVPTLTGANLVINDTTYAPASNSVIDLIHNNSGSLITTRFSGLSEGSVVVVDGVTTYLSYSGGANGRDVTLTVPGAYVYNAGDAGPFSLSKSGSNLVLTDNGVVVDSRPAITVSSYTLNAGSIDTQFTTDFSGGNPIPSGGLNFVGVAPLNNTLIVSGGAGFTTLQYDAKGTNGSGDLIFNGTSTLSFTNLKPVTVNPVAGTVTININNGGSPVAGPITSTFTGSAGMNTVTFGGNGAGLESLTFADPSAALVVNDTTTPSGGDQVIFSSLDSGFNAALTVNNNKSGSEVDLNTGLSLGSVTSTGGVAITSPTIKLGANISTNANAIATGGAVTLTGPVTLTTGTVSIDTHGTTSGGAVSFTSSITGGTNGLTLHSGNATIGVTGAVSGVGTLTLTNSGGATFASTVNANTVALTNTTGAIAFQGNLTVNTALTTTASGYSVALGGAANSIAGSTTFSNTGGVTLGQAAGSTTFTGGVTSTASTTTTAGTISATNQPISLGTTVLAAATTLSAGSGSVTLGGTTGAFALTANSTGTTTFGGAVNVASVLTNAGGTTAINGGAVTTSGTQTYNDAVTLGASTTLTGTTVSFLNDVNSLPANTNALSVMGNAAFQNIGNTSALLSLSVSGATTLNGISTQILTASGQTFTGPVTLNANVSDVNSISPGTDVTFSSTIDSQVATTHILSLTNNGGNIVLAGAVGGTTELYTLQLSGGTAKQIMINGGSVHTASSQTYQSPVLLGQNTTLTTDASGVQFTVSAPINMNGHDLTLNAGATGIITLGGALIGGGNFSVTNGAAENFAAVTATSVTITTAQTSIDFNGAISLTGNLTVTTTAAAAPIVLHSKVTAANTSITGGGIITVGGKLTDGTAGTVLLHAGNTLTINGAIDPSTVDLSTTTGDILINAPVSATTSITGSAATTSHTGNVTIGGTGSVVTSGLGSTIALSAGTTSGTVTVNGAVTAQNATGAGNQVSLTASAGSILGTATVTATTVLLSAATGISNGASGLATSATNITATNSGAALVYLANNLASGTATINSLYSTGGPVELDQSGGAALQVSATGSVRSGGSGSTVTGGSITLKSTAVLTVPTGALVSSAIGSGGTATIIGTTDNGTVTAGAGNILLQGGAGQDTLICSPLTAASINLTSTRDVIICAALTSTTGDITLTGNSGNANGVDVGGVWIENTGSLNSGGKVTITGSDLFNAVNGTNVVGVQVDLNTVPLTSVKAVGNIAFNVNGNNAAGLAILGGTVQATGAASTIDVTAGSAGGGTINLGANVSANAGKIELHGNVGLTAGVTVDAGGAGNVLFDGTVNGAQALVVNSSATTTFSGAVGNTTPLTTLTTDAPGTTAINGGAVTTTGNQSYNDNATLGAATSLTTTANGNISFGGTLNNGQSLNLTAGTGSVTFTGAVGGTTPLSSITINSANNVTFSSTVATSGAVTQSAGTGTTTFKGTSGTGIGGNLSINTFAIVLNSANLAVVGDTDLTATQNITANAGLSTTAGHINFTANSTGTTTGDFTAITLYALITSSTGAISLNGHGGNGTGGDHGIYIGFNGAVTTSGPIANITLVGTGAAASGATQFRGVWLDSGLVSTAAANIMITGQGGGGGGSYNNVGVDFTSGGKVTAGASGSVAITGTGGGGGSSHDDQGVDLLFSNNNAVTAVNGNITITGTGGSGSGVNEIGLRILGGGVVKTTGTGGITVNATGKAGAQGVLVSGNSSIAAGVGSTAPLSITAGFAGVDAGVQVDGGNSLSATSTMNVSANAGGGDIVLNGPATAGTTMTLSATGGAVHGSALLTATSLAASAMNGIGSGSALNTQVSNLAATNSTTGNVLFANSVGGLLTITTVSGVVGVTNADASHGGGTISVTNAGLNNGTTVSQAVVDSAGGGITLSPLTCGTLTLGANVTASGGNGGIQLTAGSITQTAGTVSAVGTGNVTYDAGVAETCSGANISMTQGTAATSVNGNIVLHATGSVALSNVVTNNGTVTATADTGAITNNLTSGNVTTIGGGDLAIQNNVVINSGALLTLKAATGIGAASAPNALAAIDTAVRNVTASTTSGGTYITNTGSLTIVAPGVTATSGDVQVRATGNGTSPTLNVPAGVPVSTGAGTVTLTENDVNGGAVVVTGPVDDSTGNVFVLGGPGNDTITINSTHNTPFTLNGGAGVDTYNIYMTASTTVPGALGEMTSPVTINDSDGSGTAPGDQDRANVYDLTENGQNIYTVDAGQVFNTTSNKKVLYNAGLENITLFGEAGTTPVGDVFNVTPSQTTRIKVVGGIPVPPALPGDVLNYVPPTSPATTITQVTCGTIFFQSPKPGLNGDDYQPIDFASIETLNLNPPAFPYTSGFPAAAGDFSRFQFKPPASPAAASYVSVLPTTAYPGTGTTGVNGYGWASGTVTGVDRGAPTTLLRAGALGTSATFKADVADAGFYEVNYTLGDRSIPLTGMTVTASGGPTFQTVTPTFNTLPGQFINQTLIVQVEPGQHTISLKFQGSGGRTGYFDVHAVEIQPAKLLTLALVPTNPTPVADGTTVQTINGSHARPNALITVSTDAGTIVSGDANTDYAGIQVLTDANGNFSFQLKAPTGAVTADISAQEVTVGTGTAGLDGTSQALLAAKVGLQTGCIGLAYSVPLVQRLDFNASTAVTAPGFQPVRASNLFDPSVALGARTGYGWLPTNSVTHTGPPVSEFDRGGPSPLRQDGHYGTDGTFEIQATPGVPYTLRLYLGDPTVPRDNIKVIVNGIVLNGNILTGAVNVGGTIGSGTYGFDTSAGQTITPTFNFTGGASGVTTIRLFDFSPTTGFNPSFSIEGLDLFKQGNDPGIQPMAAVFPSFGPPASVASLTSQELAPIVNEAIADWAHAGLTPRQVAALRQARVTIGDLSRQGLLGETLPDGTIVIDATADGYGWYTGTKAGLKHSREYDLLTVVLHELGHEIGLSDVPSTGHAGNVMDDSLAVGERLLPSPSVLAALDHALHAQVSGPRSHRAGTFHKTSAVRETALSRPLGQRLTLGEQTPRGVHAFGPRGK